VRLRRGFELEHLADLFSLSKGQVSRIVNTWILLMADRLGQINFWPPEPPKDPLLIPNELRDKLKNLMIIVDGTEIRLQKPSATGVQKEMFSSYKNNVTAKMLVGIDGDGTIIFSSRVYAGRTSDKKLFMHCGVLNELKKGDLVMADRGFDIEKHLESFEIEVTIPDFLKGKLQFSADQLKNSENIAEVRVHVERAIQKIKSFKILDPPISLTLTPMLDSIWVVCSVLANFTGSGFLVKPKE